MPTPQLEALRTSVDRLRATVEPLDDAVLGSQAYPSEWTVAQVLSHLGSGAVIHRRRLDDGLNGDSLPDEFPSAVWDEWNAKRPRAQADDALAADADLLARIDALTAEERERFSFSLGPLTFDLPGLIALRLNEHAVHSWDIQVVLDSSATIPSESARFVVDNLQLIARYTGRHNGEPTTITVRTTEPERTFTLGLTTDGVSLEPGASSDNGAVLELPAEAFARLLYGRLDPNHTPPAIAGDPTVDRLRRTFPGP